MSTTSPRHNYYFSTRRSEINEVLHIGGINKNDRAKTMAALLLSVVDEPPNLETKLPVLIGEINTRSRAVLTQHSKPEFAPYVHILPPSNARNHVKFKGALVKTIQELQNLNIRSAMNSSTDVLGQFYEGFSQVRERCERDRDRVDSEAHYPLCSRSRGGIE